MFKLNPIFCTDAYKVSHKKFETKNTEFVQANFTPRSFRLSPIPLEKAVVFGVQRMTRKLYDLWKENFFDQPRQAVLDEALRVLGPYLGMAKDDLAHFGELHDLGYLPIEIRSLPEGTLVGEKTPIMTIHNTLPEFSWLVTYLETWISTEMWLPMTSATTAYHLRKLVNKYALETTGSTAGTEFQLHDFSYRGMGPDEAGTSGAGFLLSSLGTDTIPAICELEYYYDARIEEEPIAFSVPATEHSVTCVGIAVNGEKETIRNWITDVYPAGIVSIVADTLDFFKVITEYAAELKEDILNRRPNATGLAKTVFRPDSGDPVKILTGYTPDEYEERNGEFYEIEHLPGYLTRLGRKLSKAEIKGAVECLWDIFGGTTTKRGYKVLHERVGLIYGDSITYERAENIMTRLRDKGFASTNCVFGIGSYTMRYVTRDTLGSAVKVTWARVDGQDHSVEKNPATDTSGVKKSAKGFLDVTAEGLVAYDSIEDALDNRAKSLMELVFYKVDITNTDLSAIRKRLWG